MIKTKDGKEIVLLRQYDKNSERMTGDEAEKLLKSKGLRMLKSDEWLDTNGDKIVSDETCPYRPFWLKTTGGLLVRGVIFYVGSRGVLAGCDPGGRYGVVGVADKPHKHDFEKQPRKCKGCGSLEGEKN